MKPIGPLMKEHRLIERMMGVLARADQGKDHSLIRNEFLGTAVDFLRVYVDELHHGKEEAILFKQLESKKLSEAHSRILKELIEEHKSGRELVVRLDAAWMAGLKGVKDSSADVRGVIKELTLLYRAHIDKEDNQFFYPSLEYFSAEEQDAMVEEMQEFDLKLTHDHYTHVVDTLETGNWKKPST